MCGPFAIPLALMAAGTVAKYFGDKQAQGARESTFAAERMRQKGFEQQQQDAFSDSLAKTADMQTGEAVQKAADAREGTLAAAIVPGANQTGAYMPGSDSAPSVVKTAQDTADAKTTASGQSLARSLAALGGTTDQFQGLNRQLGRNAQQIGQIGGFARGSSNVLQSEMTAASAKGGFLRGIGGLAQSIGQAWLTGSAIGGLGAGAGGATVTAPASSSMSSASAGLFA